MKQYRRSNGRFISKAEARAIQLFPLRLAIVSSTIIAILCFAACPSTIDWVRTPEVHADYNPCGLIGVICEGDLDAKTQKAINEIPHTSSTTEEWIKYLYTEADKHNVDPEPMAHAIYCESMFTNTQSAIVKHGKREPSYGLVQLHIPSHKDITRDQALTPHFAIDYIVNNFQNDTWYGYDRTHDRCASGVKPYWN